MQSKPSDEQIPPHPLVNGTLLSHYRIIEKIGAGGMGEVYRAQDTRLGRDVAIKVLSPRLAPTAEVRARFEREARTISQLNHPRICTLHDIGHQDGMDYLVMELLEGETLADRLRRGPLPVAETLALGAQIAEGLDAAHRKGIVHRDLKPGNVMLTKAGVKLMDFGLARASVSPVAGAEADSPTMSRPLTEKGTLVGTFQYMAPEQLEGKEADARSDTWALGCVLYEMATGKPSFEGTSQASLIAAIMEREPRPITELQPLTPPALDSLVKRCLAKEPDERWQSARDISFGIRGIAEAGPAPAAGVGRDAQWRRRFYAVACGGIALAALLAAAVFYPDGLWGRRHEPPKFTRLTFQRGRVWTARFAPDGKSVLYDAAWEGRPYDVFETRADLSTGRSLGYGAHLYAVSRTGELAIGGQEAREGVLSIVPTSGSAPRDLMADVQAADWSGDGKVMAIVRNAGGERRLEMPPGHVLVTTAGALSDIRISRDGCCIAFAEHPVVNDTRGTLAVVDLAGRKKVLTGEFSGVGGLAWSPNGREIRFTASPSGIRQKLFAVTLAGRLRSVAQFPDAIFLHDIAPDGRMLLVSQRGETGIRGKSSTDENERELGWLDFPWPRALSADGKTMLFDDEGETGGPTYTTYVRRMDGSLPMRLGEGAGCALSPDGRWALTINFGPPPRLVQIATGSGDTLSLPRGQVETYQDASYFSDGRRIVFVGAERGRPQRTWVQDLPGGLPTAITPEGTIGTITSPDGGWVAAVAPDSTLMVVPSQGGESRAVAKLIGQEAVRQWSTDGRTLFVSRTGTHLDVFCIDVGSGKRAPWRTFEVPDPAGVSMHREGFIVTRDGKSYVYGYIRNLDELYLVEGLK